MAILEIAKKWNLVEKLFHEIDLFYLMSFLAWTFLNFLVHYEFISSCAQCRRNAEFRRHLEADFRRHSKGVFMQFQYIWGTGPRAHEGRDQHF